MGFINMERAKLMLRTPLERLKLINRKEALRARLKLSIKDKK